jgi:phage-related protein
VPDKPLVWLGSARRDIRAFPADAQRRSGFQLRKVQHALDPDDWKPMTSVGPGVREIRIQTELAHRVFYLATFEEAVYVLHAFEKKTPKTPRHDIEVARERYRALLKKRAEDAKKR